MQYFIYIPLTDCTSYFWSKDTSSVNRGIFLFDYNDRVLESSLILYSSRKAAFSIRSRLSKRFSIDISFIKICLLSDLYSI